MLLLPWKSVAYLEPNFKQQVCVWLFKSFEITFIIHFQVVLGLPQSSEYVTWKPVASFGSGGSRKPAAQCLSGCGRTAEGICRRHLAFPSPTEQPLLASACFCLDASSFSGKLGISWARCIFPSSLSPAARRDSPPQPLGQRWGRAAARPPSCPLAPLGAFPPAHELPCEFGPVTDIGCLYVLMYKCCDNSQNPCLLMGRLGSRTGLV